VGTRRGRQFFRTRSRHSVRDDRSSWSPSLKEADQSQQVAATEALSMILEAAALPVYAASWLLYIATLSAFRLAGCLLWSRTLAGSGNRFVVRGPGAVEANDCQIQHIWAEAGEMVRVSDSFRTGCTG